MEYHSVREDSIAYSAENAIGPDGMKIDRMYFEKSKRKLSIILFKRTS